MSARVPAGVDGFHIGGRRLGGAALWTSDAARQACAARDVGALFRLLQHHGVSQRRIAAATGQSQSEIPEILKGRRVRHVDVLERIADGLGTPRSWWRLAGDETGGLVGVDVATAVQSALVAACMTMLTALGVSTVENVR
jgi:hypothetical protein